MSPAAFVKHAETGLFEEMPHLGGVWLQGAEKSLGKALESPFLSRLTSLTLSVFGSLNRGTLLDRLASISSVAESHHAQSGHGPYGDAGNRQAVAIAPFSSADAG